MNEITITVRGEAGTGKTTLGMLIYSVLQEHGFDCTLEDLDQPLGTANIERLMTAGLQALPKRTRVTIMTQMAPRLPNVKQ
jgi:thymidylate kinase